MYNLVRWALFFFVLYLAISSVNPWLYGLAFFIVLWPKPEERSEMFYGTTGIFNRDKPKY